MSEKFAASNGQTVAIVDGDLMVGNPPLALSPVGVEAMREFFLHERDQELGRWRDHEECDWVAYPGEPNGDGARTVRVVNEVDGFSTTFSEYEVDAFQSSCLAGVGKARAYFAAHPLPKPAWHDAKPGEVWALKLESGTECAATREYGVDFKLSYGNLMSPRDERIIAGRRIWPEEGLND